MVVVGKAAWFKLFTARDCYLKAELRRGYAACFYFSVLADRKPNPVAFIACLFHQRLFIESNTFEWKYVCLKREQDKDRERETER